MRTILLRPAEPERDFGQIAALISSQEDERTSQAELTKDLAKNRENVIRLTAADDEDGELMGFCWAYRSNAEPEWVTFYLVVKPERRQQGAGGALYEDLVQACQAVQVKRLRISVRDSCPECRAFAERRGFVEKRHHFGMALDLDSFDFLPYDAIIERLKGDGFEFTSMEALGNTEEAQRKLYALNDSAAASTPGSEGEHPWASFDDFQKSVCQSDWYKPGGQMVAIETATGDWAAMSAITRLEKNDHAYNLFTGVDLNYRGRKLGQAVKVQALRYAREVLKVNLVRTHHNTRNMPMIAIDRKLGYTPLPGTFLMEKTLE
jgi:GNAT superfamily N-acetyltransferase